MDPMAQPLDNLTSIIFIPREKRSVGDAGSLFELFFHSRSRPRPLLPIFMHLCFVQPLQILVRIIPRQSVVAELVDLLAPAHDTAAVMRFYFHLVVGTKGVTLPNKLVAAHGILAFHMLHAAVDSMPRCSEGGHRAEIEGRATDDMP